MPAVQQVNISKDMKDDIAKAIEKAIGRLKSEGVIPSKAAASVPIEIPKDPKFGDFASPVALSLAKEAGLKPRDLALKIAGEVMEEKDPLILKVEVAGPGFINLYLADKWLDHAVKAIRKAGSDYGRSGNGAGERVNVEFVSANPVGPLNIVNARAAAVGDSLVRMMNFTGYKAESEFYVNDAGNQVGVLTDSVYARFRQSLGEDYPFPEEGYQGLYVKDMAEKAKEEFGPELANMPPEEAKRLLRPFSLKQMLEWQKRSLKAYDVEFDTWTSEKSLRDKGAVEEALDRMRDNDDLYEEEGAVWFKSTKYGDDKDRVMIKGDGEYTYVAPDFAYHLDKLGRGFTKLIDVLGPDHHGYQGRMQAGIKSFGYPEGTLYVLILQLVTLLRGGEAVKMSKRAGEFITMDDLLEEVPKDAARYFFIMRNTNSHLEFDMEVAAKSTPDNPVWYVQYAHARCCSIFEKAQREGTDLTLMEGADCSLLNHPTETALVRRMSVFPDELWAAVEELQPSRMARYAYELAGEFHRFYTECRVVSEDAALSAARLALVDAVRITIANLLPLMGISAPERM